jgi:hypothetical protein
VLVGAKEGRLRQEVALPQVGLRVLEWILSITSGRNFQQENFWPKLRFINTFKDNKIVCMKFRPKFWPEVMPQTV